MSEPSINQYVLAHADAKLRRLQALNRELLEALHVIVKADSLEVAQSIAASAIAIAIARDES